MGGPRPRLALTTEARPPSPHVSTSTAWRSPDLHRIGVVSCDAWHAHCCCAPRVGEAPWLIVTAAVALREEVPMSTPNPPPREPSMLAAMGLALLITAACVSVAALMLNLV